MLPVGMPVEGTPLRLGPAPRRTSRLATFLLFAASCAALVALFNTATAAPRPQSQTLLTATNTASLASGHMICTGPSLHWVRCSHVMGAKTIYYYKRDDRGGAQWTQPNATKTVDWTSLPAWPPKKKKHYEYEYEAWEAAHKKAAKQSAAAKALAASKASAKLKAQQGQSAAAVKAAIASAH